MESERVTVGPNFCAGKFCIRSLCYPVSRLLGLLAAGETKQAILSTPTWSPRISAEALRYAAYLAEEETVEFARRGSWLICP